MKTIAQIVALYKSKTLDGRDLNRLLEFIPEDQLDQMGVKLNPEFVGKHVAKELTREGVMNQLKKDVEFGFKKALDKRGISSSLMFEVVMMWNWVLEDGLESYDEDNDYAQYGLPLFKTTAVKYGFDNPIGNDKGNEWKYSSEGN